MPIFYFHVRGSRFEAEDAVGQELPGIEEARREAVLTARDLLSEETIHGMLPCEERIEVEDEQRRPVLSMPIVAAAQG